MITMELLPTQETPEIKETPKKKGRKKEPKIDFHFIVIGHKGAEKQIFLVRAMQDAEKKIQRMAEAREWEEYTSFQPTLKQWEEFKEKFLPTFEYDKDVQKI